MSDEAGLRRALWICDYFPRPHDMTTGTWALENAIALQRAGLPAVVLAPTPWIPAVLAVTTELRHWSRVPALLDVRGVPVYYPRCPHYPRKWVHNAVYTKFPFLDTGLVWPWCKNAIDRMMATHPFEVVHANFLFPSGYLGMRIKERYGTPLVVHERSIQRLAMARENPARGRAYRRILRAADLVLTENSQMAAELRELEPAAADVRVLVQPGTHPDQVSSLRQERPPAFKDKRVILSVGALSKRKGHEYLIRAVGKLRAEIPDIACRIIGGGPEQARLEELVQELGLSGMVEICGKRSHAEVLASMSWCDAFSLASWGEASGTVYGEAMQFGKPVIACEGEGIAEVLRDREHGRLVPPRDAQALADALRWLLEDPARQARIGEQARKLADASLSYPSAAKKLIGLYGALVSSARQLRPASGSARG